MLQRWRTIASQTIGVNPWIFEEESTMTNEREREQGDERCVTFINVL